MRKRRISKGLLTFILVVVVGSLILLTQVVMLVFCFPDPRKAAKQTKDNKQKATMVEDNRLKNTISKQHKAKNGNAESNQKRGSHKTSKVDFKIEVHGTIDTLASATGVPPSNYA